VIDKVKDPTLKIGVGARIEVNKAAIRQRDSYAPLGCEELGRGEFSV